MKFLLKSTRILLKTLLYSAIFVLVLLVSFYFMLQSPSFQTWAAQKATTYFSKKLGTKITIQKLKVSFIKNIVLQDVYIEDKHHDTLLYGNKIQLDIRDFDYSSRKLSINELKLDGIKIKILQYKKEKDLNFQFLIDYFSPSDTIKSDSIADWKIKYGALTLTNIDFTYKIIGDTSKIYNTINYKNIHLTNVNGSFSDIDFKNDTIFSQINNLTANEQCGLSLKNLTTQLSISSNHLHCDKLYLKTSNSLVKGNLSFKYDDWSDYSNFINKVYIKCNLKDSTNLNMKDVTYFAKEISGFTEFFFVKGQIEGFVNDFHGSYLDLNYGKNTNFKGDISIRGLPDIKQSFIHIDAENISTSKYDIDHFPIPPFDKPTFLKLPKEVAKLGIVKYKGKFDGFINNFFSYGTFKTDVGDLKTNIQLRDNSKTKLIEYTGSLSSSNFNLFKLISVPNFSGPIVFTSKIKGKGLTLKDIDVLLDADVQSLTYNLYQYQKIKVNGAFKNKIFNGKLICKDVNADFDFIGSVDFNQRIPKMDFISTINNFDLLQTHFSSSKLDGKISSQILINLYGDNIDNLSGQINFDHTIYTNATKDYKLNTFNLDLDQVSDLKNIKLNSNIFNFQLDGKYKLSTLPNAFSQYLNNYFPTFFKTSNKSVYNDKVNLKLKIKDFILIKELFLKDLMISPNSMVEVSFDAGINYLYLKTTNDLVNYAGVKFYKNNFIINSLTDGINFNYSASTISANDSLFIKNTSIELVANDKKSNFNLSWNNSTKPLNSGIFNGNIFFDNSKAEVIFDKIKITASDSVWQIAKQSSISIDTTFAISIRPIIIYNNNQLITIEGKLSKKSTDKFYLSIENFKPSQFNPILAKSKISLDGSITGNVSIYGAFDKSILTSNINFFDLKFNQKLVGSGEITSEYNPEKEYVSISGYSSFAKDLDGNLLKNIDFTGVYYNKKKEDNLDIKFKAEPFDLAFLQPYLKDILTVKVGYLNGTGQITGTLQKPLINAKLKIMKCVILVDYLNVQYTLSGDVNVKPNQLNFDNLEIRDKTGNSGSVDGNIFHNNFNNMRIDFDVNTKKMMLLNTTSANNSSYYGTAYASGNVGIYGFMDDVKVEVNMKTNGGTRIYIPLSASTEVANNEFIQFVTKDTVKKIVPVSKSNLSLAFNLQATSDAEVQLIFDEKSGDVIKAKGDGYLNFTINSKGKFDMFGDYVLSTGDYLFTLENFITKKFEIEKGSSIKWNGNIYKADIDIVANYSQRASVKPLFPNDSSSNYNKRFPVYCKLFMKDKLTSPDISFGIDLPTIDENTRSLIKNLLIDPSELNRQVFSLLLLRSFVTPISVAGGSGVNAGNAAAATGSEMLSNKLSSWLNGVTKNIDVGVNYRPGNSLSNDQLDLALSKQLFNNRLVIDGNIGVTNNNLNNKTANNSNLIGDVTLEYKLTESGKYRLKGFNRSNDNTQVLNSGGPFTQGVGVFYREEFENFRELYRRYLAKLKKKK
ncbi:MAG: translocation/assembly module TamB domain-containing protein [Bacteroidota bacterium]